MGITEIIRREEKEKRVVRLPFLRTPSIRTSAGLYSLSCLLSCLGGGVFRGLCLPCGRSRSASPESYFLLHGLVVLLSSFVAGGYVSIFSAPLRLFRGAFNSSLGFLSLVCWILYIYFSFSCSSSVISLSLSLSMYLVSRISLPHLISLSLSLSASL
jgi:hypothetical protein